MKVFLLFLDGVGIGTKDPDVNPFFRASLPALRSLFGGEIPHADSPVQQGPSAIGFGVDANLGVDGLPQSGTGQATIFTGENAARKFGRHFGPFLPSDLKPMVTERSMFAHVRRSGRSAVFANAFPQRYFDYTNGGTRRLSALVFSAVSAGVPLLSADDLARDQAVSADFLRDRWPELGHPEVAPVSAHDAGLHAARLAAQNDLTVFDYWLPDHTGHRQNMPNAVRVLENLDAFLDGLVRNIDVQHVTVLGISDHGNVEDLSTKAHTRNPAFSFLVGRRRDEAQRISSLTDVAPFVYECLNVPMPSKGG